MINVELVGASTIKWTILDPCTCSSESNQNNMLEFCEKKSLTFLEHIDLISQEICVDRFFVNLLILKANASDDIK